MKTLYGNSLIWLLPTLLHNGVGGFTSSSVPTRMSRRPFQVLQKANDMCFFVGNVRSDSSFLKMSTSTNDDDVMFVEAQDGEALQTLFAKQCDDDGLMTIDSLKKVPAIAELLRDGDLLAEELVDIWEAAPKFPEETEKERIDVDSFIQIYRDIDDMFEDENDDQEEEESDIPVAETNNKKVVETKSNTKKNSVKAATKSENNVKVASTTDTAVEDNNDDEDEQDDVVARDEAELETLFQSICDDNGLVTKDGLRQWDEIQKLLQDGLLGDDEFDDLWTRTAKSPGSSEQLDVDGFLSFNVALDELFVFDDEDDEAGDDDIMRKSKGEDSETTAVDDTDLEQIEGIVMVTDDDLPPGVLFAELANEKQLVGMNELKRWGELQDMLADGDLLPLELQNIYDDIPKAKHEMLNEEGFLSLCNAIDDLFEQDEDDDDKSKETEAPQQPSAEDVGGSTSSGAIKAQLLAFLDDLNSDVERLPCGLESSELEEKQALTIVSALETEPANKIKQTGGAIQQTELAGDWELLYSSSSAMKFNKGLSGLGGSFPNGQFGGLVQKLQANKYVTDMEYVERIEVNPSTASFDVRVNGDWSLRGSVSLFTGEPSLIMSVVPDRVMYGPTSTRADHWKSLGPLNQLDMTYLDDDLRIMRGSTSTDTIFVFRRM